MKIINNNIEILSEYVTAHNYVDCRCKIDGYTWRAEANSLIRGFGCTRCAKKESYSPEQFKHMVYDINPNIQLLSDYINNKTPINCKCNIDGYEWSTYPTHLLSNVGCAKCAGVATKTTQQFKDELFVVNPDIKVVGEYISNKHGIECMCLIDGHIWSPSPNSLLRGKGCPKCSGRLGHTHDEFVQLLHEINPNITVIGKYINTAKRVKCKCNIDGHIWNPIASSILFGRGCPICKSSKGEIRISKYLKSKNIDFEREYRFEDCRNILCLPFDFYIHTHNTAIEYDGEHHSQIVIYSNESIEEAKKRLAQRKINDGIKTKYCEEHNINLIRIPYTEFNEIENILDKYLF